MLSREDRWRSSNQATPWTVGGSDEGQTTWENGVSLNSEKKLEVRLTQTGVHDVPAPAAPEKATYEPKVLHNHPINKQERNNPATGRRAPVVGYGDRDSHKHLFVGDPDPYRDQSARQGASAVAKKKLGGSYHAHNAWEMEERPADPGACALLSGLAARTDAHEVSARGASASNEAGGAAEETKAAEEVNEAAAALEADRARRRQSARIAAAADETAAMMSRVLGAVLRAAEARAAQGTDSGDGEGGEGGGAAGAVGLGAPDAIPLTETNRTGASRQPQASPGHEAQRSQVPRAVGAARTTPHTAVTEDPATRSGALAPTGRPVSSHSSRPGSSLKVERGRQAMSLGHIAMRQDAIDPHKPAMGRFNEKYSLPRGGSKPGSAAATHDRPDSIRPGGADGKASLGRAGTLRGSGKGGVKGAAASADPLRSPQGRAPAGGLHTVASAAGLLRGGSQMLDGASLPKGGDGTVRLPGGSRPPTGAKVGGAVGGAVGARVGGAAASGLPLPEVPRGGHLLPLQVGGYVFVAQSLSSGLATFAWQDRRAQRHWQELLDDLAASVPADEASAGAPASAKELKELLGRVQVAACNGI